MLCCSLLARTTCCSRKPWDQAVSVAGGRVGAACRIASKDWFTSASNSTAPRRLSRNSAVLSAKRKNFASPNTAGEPYANWKSSLRPKVITKSAWLITLPRMAATTAGWSSGTKPLLSPVSKYTAPKRVSSCCKAGPAFLAPLPEMNKGRLAFHSKSTAWPTSCAEGKLIGASRFTKNSGSCTA